jgi:hypothetical protein
MSTQTDVARPSPVVPPGIKRSGFDMKFNQALSSGNVLVGDRVTISRDISAIKQS